MKSTLGQYAGLNALVGARIYPDQAPQGCARPYVVWQEIIALSEQTLDGDTPTGGVDNIHVQVTAWCESQDDARSVAAQIRAAMAAATLFNSTYSEGRALPRDFDSRLYGQQIDFSVWYRT